MRHFRLWNPGRPPLHRMARHLPILSTAFFCVLSAPIHAEVFRVSVGDDGAEADGGSESAAISFDGGFAAFQSDASNLVPGDGNGLKDIFVRDLVEGSTTRVSVSLDASDPNGDSGQVSMSGDGRVLAYVSEATNLVPDQTGAGERVFIHRRETVENRAILQDWENRVRWNPVISPDGQSLVFSHCEDWPEGDGYARFHLYDLQTGAIDEVGPGAYRDGGWICVRSSAATCSWSKDSRKLACMSYCDDCAVHFRFGEVYIYDRVTGERTSVLNTEAGGPSMNLDGRFLAVTEYYWKVVDAEQSSDIVVYDLETDARENISLTAEGERGDGYSWGASISGDGRFVAYTSAATDLVPDDFNDSDDVFIHDRWTKRTRRLSIGESGIAGNGDSRGAAISHDGRYVAFESEADNLVPGDGNGEIDVFVASNPFMKGPCDTIGLYDPARARFHLKESLSGGVADLIYWYGPLATSWTPLTGDWNDDGRDTPGLYAPETGTFHLTNTHAGGPADLTFRYAPTAFLLMPISGDWNGDGFHTVGLYDPWAGIFHLRNSNSEGPSDLTFRYGPLASRAQPLSGDWDGDGRDSVGLYDPVGGRFYLKNENTSGYADLVFRFGPLNTDWLPITGDWVGDGVHTPGFYDRERGVFHVKYTNSGGVADLAFRYGPTGHRWWPVTGNW